MSFETTREDRGLGPFVIVSILLHGILIAIFPIWQSNLPPGFPTLEQGGVVQVIAQGVPGGQPPKRENTAAVVADRGKPAEKSKQEGEKTDVQKAPPAQETAPEPKPEAKAESPTLKTTPQPEQKPQTKTQKPPAASKPEPAPAPKPDPTPTQPAAKPTVETAEPKVKQATSSKSGSKTLTSERGPEVVVPEAKPEETPVAEETPVSEPPKAEPEPEPEPVPKPKPDAAVVKGPETSGSSAPEQKRDVPGEESEEGGPKAGDADKESSPGVAESPPPAQSLHASGGAPIYPKNAQDRGAEGSVVLSVSVAKDGRINAVEILTPSNVPELDRAARLTVERQWKFKPEAADYVVVIEVVFANHTVEVNYVESRYL